MRDSAIDRFRGLLDVAAAVRTGGELRSVLEAVAGAIAGPLGYRAVVINLYRPAWDDFEVVVVLGNEESQEMLMGQTSGMEDWSGLLSDRFLRHGAYFVAAGEYDWSGDRVQVYTPELEVSDDPDAWHPDDALIVPLRSADGALLGIVSVDEPVTGRRPAQVELELLSTIVAYAAVAVEQAQTAELGRRHRAAVEHLLAVSAQLTERRTSEEMLDAVCWGVREALGFDKVVAFLAEEGKLVPLSGVGFTAERAAEFPRVAVESVVPLVESECVRHGCVVIERDEAVELTPEFGGVYSSVANGRGPLAWNHHWVVVPLHDSRRAGSTGMIWVDDPSDRLLPADETLQALRVFANQAMGASSPRASSSDAPPGRARPADRAAQPPRLRAVDRAPPRRAGSRRGPVAARDRPRQLQAHQRLARPRRRATRCCGASPACCGRPRATPTCRRGSAARSSRSCCRAPARRRR